MFKLLATNNNIAKYLILFYERRSFMYTIGEISKIVNISTDTLRYYDEIGLLKPVQIDTFSKYRYYSDDQVKYILLIMELKQYGFTLDEIKNLMNCKDALIMQKAFCKRLEELEVEVTTIMHIISILTKRINEYKSEENIMNNKKTILIVDDIALVRFLLKNILEKYDYRIVGEAVTGLEAVEKYVELKPDLVIMDIVMPIMDGIYATQKIRERDEKAKIIMCSAMTQTVIAIESLIAGACGFLCKPFTEIKLINEVDNALSCSNHFDSVYLSKSLDQLQNKNYDILDKHKLLFQVEMDELIQLFCKKPDHINFDRFIIETTTSNSQSSTDHYMSLRDSNIGNHILSGLVEFFKELLENSVKINDSKINRQSYILRLCSIDQNLNLDTLSMIDNTAVIGIIKSTEQVLPIAIVPFQELMPDLVHDIYDYIYTGLHPILSDHAEYHKISGEEFRSTYDNVYPQVNILLELVTTDSKCLLCITIPHETLKTNEFCNRILQWKLKKL